MISRRLILAAAPALVIETNVRAADAMPPAQRLETMIRMRGSTDGHLVGGWLDAIRETIIASFNQRCPVAAFRRVPRPPEPCNPADARFALGIGQARPFKDQVRGRPALAIYEFTTSSLTGRRSRGP